MSKPDRYDVAVIGAGPAGSSCATVLARAGIKAVLIDKARFPRDKICGDCLNPNAWRLLDNLGVKEEVLSRGPARLTSLSLVNTRGRRLDIRIPSNATEPFVALSRRELDDILLQNAGRNGAAILASQSVRNVSWNGRWKIHLENDVLESEYLVGADGRNSLVARLFGATVPSAKDSAGRVGFQWNCPRLDCAGTGVFMMLFKSGYCGIVNLNDRTANVAMVTTSTWARETLEENFLEATLGTMNNLPFDFKSLEPLTRVASAFPVDPIQREISHPRVFLAGDARCTVEPFTGEGVFFALQDGLRIGRTLEMLIKGSPATVHEEHGRFWANRVYSPLLRRPALAGKAVALGTGIPAGIVSHFASVILSRRGTRWS